MSEIIINQVKEILDSEDTLSALCNVTALLKEETPDVNWLGYYFYKNGKLILGPFQGKVACSEITIGKGVCGVSFEKKMLLNIPNVNEFATYIACDSSTCSELVIPLIHEGKTYGVLDIDSQLYSRFYEEEEFLFEEVAKLVAKKLAQK